MHKALLTGCLVAGLLAPGAVYAQSAAAPAPSPAASGSKSEQLFTLRPTQVLVVGAGVVVGAVVLDALLPTDLALLAGGIVGGYLANIWYTGHQLEVHVSNVPSGT